MADQVSDLKLQHLVELSKLGDGCAELESRIEAWLVENDVVFDGHTIPFVLMPHFVSPGQVRRVRRAVECLSAVLNRFCDAYPDDPRLQEELALPSFEDSLVRVSPGYSCPLRICRLDAFLAGDQVKFLEFNADSPAGIGYTDVLHEGLRQAISLPGVDREFDTAYEPMLPLLIATLLDAYREMRGGQPVRSRAARDPAAGAGRRPRQPLDPRVPDHLRRRVRGGDRGGPRHHRGALLRRLGAPRRRRSGPARLPPGAGRRPERRAT